MDRWMHSQSCITLTCPFLKWKQPEISSMAVTWIIPTSGKLKRRTQIEASVGYSSSQKSEVPSTLTFQTWLTALSVHSATSMEWLCWPIRGPKQVRTGMVSAVHTPINGRTPTTKWLEQLIRVLRQELNPHKDLISLMLTISDVSATLDS